jgi:hypothetical protein
MRTYKIKCGVCGKDNGSLLTINDPYENHTTGCSRCGEGERIAYVPVRESGEDMHTVYVEREGVHDQNL